MDRIKVSGKNFGGTGVIKLKTQIGTVTHYFDKIGVAVVQLKKSVKVGDRVKITGHDREFNQIISSLQYDHKQLLKMKRGSSVGIKVDQPVKEHDVLLSVN